ncbi:hypothetical protein FJZ19_02200 [Candidatus Pacearchaeota archaeon]|nr:hypothetical protein [Candidatus Pacearchaeota archaeon]
MTILLEPRIEAKEAELIERIEQIVRNEDSKQTIDSIIDRAEQEIARYSLRLENPNFILRRKLVEKLKQLARFDNPLGNVFSNFETDVIGLIELLSSELQGAYKELYHGLCNKIFSSYMRQARTENYHNYEMDFRDPYKNEQWEVPVVHIHRDILESGKKQRARKINRQIWKQKRDFRYT